MASDSWDALAWDKLWSAPHEVIHRLPEPYGIPVVLYDLEGRTTAEVASHLRYSMPMVGVGPAAARDLLEARPGPRRPAIPATASVAAPPRVSAVPEALARATVEAAMRSRQARRRRSRGR